MGKLVHSKKPELQYAYDMSGYYDFTITCSSCKTNLTKQNWEWWSYCANCGDKLHNVDTVRKYVKQHINDA